MTPLETLKPLLAPAVRAALDERWERDEVKAILDDAFDDYAEQRAELPREQGLGGRLMVHLAALTIGLYRALRSRGLSPEEGRSLTADITWRVYSKMAAIPGALGSIGAKTAHERVERATRFFRRFPFGPPAYRMDDVEGDENVVAFDVRRCPVAYYFASQDLSEVCVDTWCNLDYPLAEQWGARLERDETIAKGNERCNFRWHVESADDGAATG